MTDNALQGSCTPRFVDGKPSEHLGGSGAISFDREMHGNACCRPVVCPLGIIYATSRRISRSQPNHVDISLFPPVMLGMCWEQTEPVKDWLSKCTPPPRFDPAHLPRLLPINKMTLL